jgi:hypothetical protein
MGFLEVLTGIFSLFSSLFGGKEKKNNSNPLTATTAHQIKELSIQEGITTKVSKKAKAEADTIAKANGDFKAASAGSTGGIQPSFAAGAKIKSNTSTATDLRFRGNTTGKAA